MNGVNRRRVIGSDNIVTIPIQHPDGLYIKTKDSWVGNSNLTAGVGFRDVSKLIMDGEEISDIVSVLTSGGNIIPDGAHEYYIYLNHYDIYQYYYFWYSTSKNVEVIRISRPFNGVVQGNIQCTLMVITKNVKCQIENDIPTFYVPKGSYDVYNTGKYTNIIEVNYDITEDV